MPVSLFTSYLFSYLGRMRPRKEDYLVDVLPSDDHTPAIDPIVATAFVCASFVMILAPTLHHNKMRRELIQNSSLRLCLTTSSRYHEFAARRTRVGHHSLLTIASQQKLVDCDKTQKTMAHSRPAIY